MYFSHVGDIKVPSLPQAPNLRQEHKGMTYMDLLIQEGKMTLEEP
jgi:hypothetical protein